MAVTSLSRTTQADERLEKRSSLHFQRFAFIDWCFSGALFQMSVLKHSSLIKTAFNLVSRVSVLQHCDNVLPITEVPSHFHFYRCWKNRADLKAGFTSKQPPARRRHYRDIYKAHMFFVSCCVVSVVAHSDKWRLFARIKSSTVRGVGGQWSGSLVSKK